MSVLSRAARLGLCAGLLLTAGFAAAQTKPILVGQTFIGTGPLAGLSTGPVAGVKAMLASVNATGGVHGRKIELQQLDDGNDGERAAANVRTLAQGGAVAIVSPIATTSSIGALKGANEARVPLIGAYTGAAPARAPSAYNFPVRIGFDEEYERIVQHLFVLGQTDIVFAHNDNPGARAAMEVTRRAIEARGKKMLGSAAIAQDGADAHVAAQQLAKLPANAVIFSTTNPVTAKFIKAYRAAGGGGQLYVFSFVDGKLLVRDVGEQAAGVVMSQVVPSPWKRVSPLAQSYRSAMKLIGSEDLSYSSMEGYIAARVLVEALRRAGPNPTPESVRTALETFSPLELDDLRVRYSSAEHQGAAFSELVLLRKDGGFLQ